MLRCDTVLLYVGLDPRATLDGWAQKDPIKRGISSWMTFALVLYLFFAHLKSPMLFHAAFICTGIADLPIKETLLCHNKNH